MRIRPIIISSDDLANPIGKNSRIFCTNELQKKLSSVFNEDNMTALQNYAEKENVKIYFSYLPNDTFHNTQMTVFKNGSLDNNQSDLSLRSGTKENFVNSMRSIYNSVSESIKKLSQK